MSKDGLAVAPQGTTAAPKGMYREIEEIEDVAKGHIRVKELIAYDFDRMEEVIDEYTGQSTGRQRKVEKSRGPYFCQTAEQEITFKKNKTDARMESFNIQLLKSTGIEKINNPENMKQFIEKEVNDG